ncbi:MAG: septum formation initiator family protein [Gemmatimonadaceae bacterium]|nr:septum formation initiator family protein [Gemmatimonadaceae bacterium]
MPPARGARGGAGGGRASGGRAPGGPLTTKQIIGRVVLVSAAVGVVAFAVQGGEFGTTDLFRLRGQIAREQAVVDSLQRVVDRLKVEKKAIETDPATQERIAREEFGMVKGEKEILYRFTDTVPPPG